MTTTERRNPTTIALIQKVLLGLCAAGTFLLIWWLLKYCAYGFDFTDESFYIVSMANPFIHEYSHTQFGFVYHPIYKLLGGDIVKLRQINVLFTFLLAWGLGYAFLKSLVPEIKNDRLTLLCITSGLATSSLITFDSWLLTPSYNSMALHALLLTSIGLVLSNYASSQINVVGWSLIGIGGWLAFMAKPSTALALSFSLVLYLLLLRQFLFRKLLLSIAISFSLLILCALLIDGSIFEFSNRILRAKDFGQILGSGHTLLQILRIDSFQISRKLELIIALVGLCVGIATAIAYSNHKSWLYLTLFLGISFFSITALLATGYVQWDAGLGQFQALSIFGLIFAAISLGLIFGKVRGLKSINASQWLISFVFLLTPHIYAFGTNGNYWRAGGSAAIFWLLAGLLFLTPLNRNRLSWFILLPVAIATQTITIILLQTGFELPYRQSQPIRLNDTELSFGVKGPTLILSNSYAEYISSAVTAAKNNGFKTGTPVIDLSGQSPGLLYALGAESIGQAWNVGGYPGSLSLAKVALSSTQCEKISISWVLLETSGPRSIPNDLMFSVGSEFPHGYSRVASWNTASGAGGYQIPRHQELYKPISISEILDNCKRIRKNKN